MSTYIPVMWSIYGVPCFWCISYVSTFLKHIKGCLVCKQVLKRLKGIEGKWIEKGNSLFMLCSNQELDLILPCHIKKKKTQGIKKENLHHPLIAPRPPPTAPQRPVQAAFLLQRPITLPCSTTNTNTISLSRAYLSRTTNVVCTTTQNSPSGITPHLATIDGKLWLMQ